MKQDKQNWTTDAYSMPSGLKNQRHEEKIDLTDAKI